MTASASQSAGGAQDPRATDPQRAVPRRRLAGNIKKGFIHGERGGEHRRQRHDGRRHRASAGVPERSRRASRRTRRAHETARAARTARRRSRSPACRLPAPRCWRQSHDGVGERGAERKRGEQRCVGQRRHGHAAQEDAPRERDGGQERGLMMPVARGIVRRCAAQGDIRRRALRPRRCLRRRRCRALA